MYIDEDHFYYGAAILQIAEDPSFTAINSYKERKRDVECAYHVNGDVGVYLKYRTSPDRKYKESSKKAVEYQFVFNQEVRDLLQRIRSRNGNAFIGLICVESREICCISYDEFHQLCQWRHGDAGQEDQITVYVSLRSGSSFRVYVTPSGTKGQILENPFVIARNKFPGRIFESA